MSKICPKCKIEKDGFLYSPSQLLKSGGWCKACNKEYYKQKSKEYRLNNKEKIVAYKKKWCLDNKSAKSLSNKDYRLNNKEKISSYKKVWYQKNKSKIDSNRRSFIRNKYNNDPFFKLRTNISLEIRNALKISNSSKHGESITKYLPYSIQELKTHLEQQFEPWMTWDNHGKYSVKIWDDKIPSTWTWNIDHIMPQSILPYQSMEDENFKKCWAPDNLRPLSAKQNIIDGNRSSQTYCE